MTVKELFDFITDPTIIDENMEDCLEKISEKIKDRNFEELTAQEKIDEEVFKNAYIPKRLDEVIDIERDINKAKAGSGGDLIYQKLTGLGAKLSVQIQPEILQENKETNDSNGLELDKEKSKDESDSETKVSSSSSSESSCEEDDSEGNEKNSHYKGSARPRDESPDTKRARKKAVKEAKAEKRKTKIKKHVKKRKEKQGIARKK